MKCAKERVISTQQELEDTEAGLCPWVSSKAAARFLGIHPDTLGEWRRRYPPHGPAWTKGIGDREGRNQHVRYDYQLLVAWARDHFAKTKKEQRLINELEHVRAELREVELEFRLQQERARLGRLSKHRPR